MIAMLELLIKSKPKLLKCVCDTFNYASNRGRQLSRHLHGAEYAKLAQILRTEEP